MRGRKLLSIALLAGVSTLVAASQARATLQLSVFENGTLALTIVDNDGNDDDIAVGRINVLPSVINGFVDIVDFTALQATSNAGSDSENAELGQTADVENPTEDGTIDVIANDTGFVTPPNPDTLFSTASSSWAGGSGDTRTFQSFLDPDDGVYPAGDGPEVPAGISTDPIEFALEGFDSDSATNSVGVSDDDGSYALSNWTSLTFTAGTKQLRNLGITTAVSAVPEPGTIALVLGGLPLVALGAWRRRRTA